MVDSRLEALAEIGLVPAAVERLRQRARREVDEGLLPASQFALAKDGEILWFESFGSATNERLFCIFSATKALISAAIWTLLEQDKLRLAQRVAEIIPEFATNGKDAVSVEQLLTHTAGFPSAPFAPLNWDDPDRRLERFAQWRLNWEPGTRFEYHPSSSMWVLAELIERITQQDFRVYLRHKILDPLGLDDLYVGLPDSLNDRVMPCSYAGEAMTPDDYRKLGMTVPPETEVTEAAILNFNRPEIRAVGMPGGGGITNAAQLALFYQALLHPGTQGKGIWSNQTVRNARTVHSGELKDPLTKVPALRGLGLILSGDERRHFRGFGKTQSPEAFGHNGAGGQIAWADPGTGLSFVYLTNCHDRHAIRQARRGVALSSLAGELVP